MRRFGIWLILALFAGAALAWAQEPVPQETAKKKQAAPAPATHNPTVQQDPPAQPVGRGKLFVKQNSWDFGYVMQNTKVTHRFIVENVGDDTLFITRIKPT
jgi:hypothetical protein